MPVGAEHVHGGSGAPAAEWILAVPFIVAAVTYTAAAVAERRGGRGWPWYRVALWILGVGAAMSGFVGPLAAQGGFTEHMLAHVLVGMVAPVALVLAAPSTLALRTMSVVSARRLSRVLRGTPAAFLTHPVVAATLNIGGLWVLYAMPLYELMQQVPLVHLLVMLHLLLVGYLFTVSLVGVDPSPHRTGLALRAVVLVLSSAAHGVLAKLIYAHPPAGASTVDVRAGAQLMFYGGDAVDLALIALLCAQWYRTSGRRLPTPATRIHMRTGGG